MLSKRLKYIADSIECADGMAIAGWSRSRPSFHTPYTSLDMVHLVVMYRLKGEYRVRRLPATADRDQTGEQRIFLESGDLVRILDGRRRNMVLHRARTKADEETEAAMLDKAVREGTGPDEFSGSHADKVFLEELEEMLARPRAIEGLAVPAFYILTRDVTQLEERKGGPVDMAAALPMQERGSFAVPFSRVSGKGIIVADMAGLDAGCSVMPLTDVKSEDPLVRIDHGIITNKASKTKEVVKREVFKGRPGALRRSRPGGYSSCYRRS
jgi:hypothetical protein